MNLALIPILVCASGKSQMGGPTKGDVPEGTSGAQTSRSLGARILHWAMLG